MYCTLFKDVLYSTIGFPLGIENLAFWLYHFIFHCRKNELHQVAQQASNIEELAEVIRASLSVMHKQWSDAMRTFHDKFDSLSNLIMDHGNF